MQKLFNYKRISFITIIILLINTAGCASYNKPVSFLKAGSTLSIKASENSSGEYFIGISSSSLTSDIKSGSGYVNTIDGVQNDVIAGAALLPTLVLCNFTCLFGGALFYGIDKTNDIELNQEVSIDGKSKKVAQKTVNIISDKLNKTFLMSDPNDSIVNSLVNVAQPQYILNASSPDTTLTTTFKGVGFKHIGNDRAMMIVQVIVTIDSVDNKQISQLYQFVSTPNDISSWANKTVDDYQHQFNLIYQRMAEDIIYTLTY